MNGKLNSELKKLVAEGYLRDAIGQLRTAIESKKNASPPPFSDSLLDEATLVSGNYESAERRFLQGNLSQEDFQQAWAKTAAACLDIINRLPEPLQRDVQPLNRKFKEAMSVHAKHVGNVASISGKRNIIVQDVTNGNVNIQQNEGVQLKHALYVLAAIIGMAVVGAISWEVYKNSEPYHFKRVIKSRNYDLYAGYLKEYGNKKAHGKAVEDSLNSNPNIMITGKWEQANLADGGHDLIFFWDENEFRLNMGGVVWNAIFEVETPGEWIVRFPGKDMDSWYLTKSDRNNIMVEMNEHPYPYKRSDL